MFSSACFSADWSFNPGLDISNGYNSNIFFTAKDKTTDYETIFTPKARIIGRTERTELKTDLSVIIEKYFEHPDLDMVNSDNSITLTYQATPRFSTSISTFFEKDDTLTRELKRAGLAEVRKDRFRYGFDLSGTYLFTDRFSMQVSGGGQFNVYPDGPYPDLDLWQASINSMYQFNPKDSIGFFVNFTDAQFEESGEIKTVSGYLFLRRDLTENTYITGGVGYRYTRTEYEVTTLKLFINPANPNIGILIPVTEKETSEDTGLIYTFSLNNNWTARFSTILEVVKEHYNSADARSIDHTYIRANFKYKLTERAYINYVLAYDTNDYEETKFLPEETRDYIRIMPYFSYKITKNLIVALRSSYEYSTSEIDNRTYDRNRFKTFFTVKYSWKRLFSSY